MLWQHERDWHKYMQKTNYLELVILKHLTSSIMHMFSNGITISQLGYAAVQTRTALCLHYRHSMSAMKITNANIGWTIPFMLISYYFHVEWYKTKCLHKNWGSRILDNARSKSLNEYWITDSYSNSLLTRKTWEISHFIYIIIKSIL